MKRVTGIGGVFFKAQDPEMLRAALPFREVRRGLWGLHQQAGAPLPTALAGTEAAAIAAPWYLVFATEADGTIIEGRLMTVRECAIVR